MKNNSRDLLSNGVAAENLHQLFPDRPVAKWAMWLQNNRNQSRTVPYRIPFVRMHGGVFYEVEALEQFADWERSRQLGTLKLSPQAAQAMRAFGVGEQGGGAYGHKLTWSVNCASTEDAEVFVRLMIESPLLVFRLSLDEAKQLIADVQDAVRVAERSTPKPDMPAAKSNYQVEPQPARVVVARKKGGAQ